MQGVAMVVGAALSGSQEVVAAHLDRMELAAIYCVHAHAPTDHTQISE